MLNNKWNHCQKCNIYYRGYPKINDIKCPLCGHDKIKIIKEKLVKNDCE
jgi:rubrerythrin